MAKKNIHRNYSSRFFLKSAPRDSNLLARITLLTQQDSTKIKIWGRIKLWGAMRNESFHLTNVRFQVLTACTLALNFLLALNFFNSCKLMSSPLPSSTSSLSFTQWFCNAPEASRRRRGLTVNREEIRSFASWDTDPQYSSWNSYSPLRIFRKSSLWFFSTNGGYPPRRM